MWRCWKKYGTGRLVSQRNDGDLQEARYGCTSITNRPIVRRSVLSLWARWRTVSSLIGAGDRSFSRAYRTCVAGWDDGYGGWTSPFVGGCHLDGVLVSLGGVVSSRHSSYDSQQLKHSPNILSELTLTYGLGSQHGLYDVMVAAQIGTEEPVD